MYYIFKLAESWSIMEEKTGKSKSLDKSEVDTLRSLFPQLLQESGNIFLALQVTAIPPNKLLRLELPGHPTPVKKVPVTS